MPVTPSIRPFIVDTIIDLLKAQFNDVFKAYYFGDPIMIPESEMPCIVVFKKSGAVEFGYTGTDENTEEIYIQVVTNKKDELGNPASEYAMQRQLMELVEGRDNTTGEYLDNSIMGVIRKNSTFGNKIINQVVRPEYIIDMRGNDTFTNECSIRLEVTEIVPVSNRS